MNEYLSLVILTTISYSSLIAASSTYENNEEIKNMIEEAGCVFRSIKQHLIRDVCLLHDYEANKMPAKPGEKLSVNMTLLSVIVMEVHEKKNRNIMRMSQFIKWFEPRIRLRKSVSDIIWLPSKHITEIWHPELDMYTKNLEEWKSLQEPYLYEKLMIIPNPIESHTEHPKDFNNSNQENGQYKHNSYEEMIRIVFQ